MEELGRTDSVSIVVPCYNESENITALYERIRSLIDSFHRAYQIIFVDDGSYDNTSEILESICFNDNRVRVLKLSGHYGKDLALYAAFKEIKSDIIVTIDGDLQNLPEDIPLLLERLKGCDAVIGWRKERRDILIKRISSYIANLIRNKVLGENFHDAGCGLRAFKKKCIACLEQYKDMTDVFFVSILKGRGYNVEEVVVKHMPRKHGKSKFNIRNRLFQNSLKLFLIWRMKKKRRIA